MNEAQHPLTGLLAAAGTVIAAGCVSPDAAPRPVRQRVDEDPVKLMQGSQTRTGDAPAGNDHHHRSGVPAGTGFAPAPVVALDGQPAARLIVDAPLPAQLATGYVVVRYRAENVRIMPVFGPAALGVTPRVGHLHVTVDDLPWHWLDASGEPLSINGLPPGPHKLLIELEDASHRLIDSQTVTFDVPPRRADPR